jgi:hypothetical protein
MSRIVVPCLLIALLGAPITAFAGSVDLPHATLSEAAAAVYESEAAAITADRAFAGGQTLSLSGLFASESTATHLALVNLAPRGNRCALTLTTLDGVRLGPVTTLTLAARENRPFVDLFEHLTAAYRETEASAAISCARAFSAFALVEDRAAGPLEVVSPVAAEQSLAIPAAVEDCPEGATCFDAPGLVFAPEPPPGHPVGRVTFPAPIGIATRFRLSLDVTVGPWYPEQPSGKHLIYWFVIKANPDMPGMLYFRGPAKNQAMTVHGIMLKHAQKKRKIVPFVALKGHTYHVDNDYNMEAGTYVVTVTDKTTEEVAVTLLGTPNVSSYQILRNRKFIVDMGFYPDIVPIEVPSYGWKYADLHLEAFVKQP